MTIALLLLVFTSVSPQGLPAPSASSVPDAVAEIGGRIVDQETGAPLKQCVIHMGSPDGQRRYKTQSDADGLYRLANVRPGRYVGGIEGPPFQGIYLVQSFTETTGGFGITLKAGEVRQFNVALKRALALTVPRRRSASSITSS